MTVGGTSPSHSPGEKPRHGGAEPRLRGAAHEVGTPTRIVGASRL